MDIEARMEGTRMTGSRNHEAGVMAMRRSAVLALGAAMTAMLALAAPVRAASPGTNGRIAFSGCGKNGCVVSTMLPNGTDVHHLTAGNAPDWSPDGQKIAFDDIRNGQPQVFTMNADGSDVQQLTHLAGGAADPSYSPDGSLLVFDHLPPSGCCGNIWSIRPDGTGLHQITHFTTENFPFQPEFSPDGQRIVFWEQSAHGGEFAAIFVMRADGTDIRQVTPLRLDAAHPKWSPDGSKIIFNNDAHLNVGDIFTIRPDGTGLKRLTDVIPLGEADFRPDFSPDGTMIVFDQLEGSQPISVWTMRSDGNNAKIIKSNGVEPNWGPRRS
jgi:Tol biopolymer transport system component